MSTDEDSEGSPLKPTTSKTKADRELEGNSGGRNNASKTLSQQRSFEARYSSIIQKQIWETTINKDVMERQLNAYFPFARSASLTKDGANAFHQLLKPTQGSSEVTLKTRSLATTPTKQHCGTSGALDVAKKHEKPIKTTPQ